MSQVGGSFRDKYEVATFLLFSSDFATFLLFFGLSDLIVILKIGFWLLALLFSHPAFCADDFTGTGIDPFDQFFFKFGSPYAMPSKQSLQG
jgi:hypothetical protein